MSTVAFSKPTVQPERSTWAIARVDSTRGMPLCFIWCLLIITSDNNCFGQSPMIPRPDYYEISVPKRADAEKLLASPIPFGTNLSGSRFQQIYSASHFPELPQAGFFITDLYFRAGCNGKGGSFITNLALRMTTTSKEVGQLSSSFDDNLSVDTVNVYGGGVITINGRLPQLYCDKPLSDQYLEWDYTIALATPFFYDPRKGNLLLDWVIPEHEIVPKGFLMLNEVTRDLSNGTSSIAAAGTNAARAEITSDTGLVTRFFMAPFPRLSVTPTESGLAVSWPTKPSPARLQERDPVAEGGLWRDAVTPGLRRNELISLWEVPNSELTKSRYFRLYWDTPQIGLPATTVEVPAKATPKPLTP